MTIGDGQSQPKPHRLSKKVAARFRMYKMHSVYHKATDTGLLVISVIMKQL